MPSNADSRWAGGYNLKWSKNEKIRKYIMKVVVIVSAEAEWEGVKTLFPGAELRSFPYGDCLKVELGRWNLKIFHSGWGKIASAGSMQYVIDHHAPDLVVNLGTCGGFEGVVEPGELILVDRTLVYDIVELMGDLDIETYYASTLDLGWLQEPHPYPARRGTIASADSDLPPEKIPLLNGKGALAADWESAALAWVAKKNEMPLLILRMVSDLVSERGGEAYGDIEIFNARAKVLMKELFEQLPDWLNAVRLNQS
jgi:adenosylhomocysteine nucleosidase